MAASDFLSQVDATRYQPVVPDQSASAKKPTSSKTNNRSEYLKQLNGTLSRQKKSTEQTPSKTKTAPQPSSKTRTDHPVAPQAKSDSRQSPPVKKASPKQNTNVQNRPANSIEQNKTSQAETEINKFSATPIDVPPESLVPPASIEELFQIDAPSEETDAAEVVIETGDIDVTTPPFGLSIALNQIDTEQNVVTPDDVNGSEPIVDDETPILSVDQTVTATNLIDVQNNTNNTKAGTSPTQTAEVVPQTESTTNELAVPQQTLVERLTTGKTERTSDSTIPLPEAITETQSNAPLILPFPKNEDQKENRVASESVTETDSEQTENLLSQEAPTAKQRITQVVSNQAPNTITSNNEAPVAQVSQQKTPVATVVNKKSSITNQPASQQEAPELALSSTSFSEVFAEIDAAKNKEETASSSQAESILNQTVTAMETSIEQGQSLKIRLTPPELGMIHIQLTTDDAGAITARLDVQTPEAQAALMQHLQNLQETLQQNGTPVEQITIQMTPQTAEDQASGDSDQPKEQSTQQEQTEEDQQENQNQQEQQDQSNETDDSDQLNIAA